MTAMFGMPLTWFSIQHSTFSTPGFVGVEGFWGLGVGLFGAYGIELEVQGLL